MPQRDTMVHLFSCFNTMYQVVGESAPTLTNDAYVIRAYESGRAFGGVVLAFREFLGDEPCETLGPLEDTLRQALEGDDAGAMLHFALATVVGPRVLVSLRDARDQVELDEAALVVLTLASKVMVQEILKVGEVSKDQAPIEDTRWQEAAKGLADRLDANGNAESFGISR
jgi:hypothetical protein